jgi:hypothetical protein
MSSPTGQRKFTPPPERRKFCWLRRSRSCGRPDHRTGLLAGGGHDDQDVRVVDVGSRLAEFVSTGDSGKVAFFAAGLVERGAGVFFLAVQENEERKADSDTYLALLDDLWRAGDLSRAGCEERQRRLGAFREMTVEEEPPGILAYAYDAVAAMYYAYAFLAFGDLEDIVSGSSHMLNSTGFIDDAVDGGDLHYDREVEAQLTDMDELSETAEFDPASHRARCRERGRARVEALRTVFG